VKARTREWVALAFAAFVALVWLNQGVSLREWQERSPSGSARSRARVVQDVIRAPFLFLYRRALDEEMYFATASAMLGRPYDETIFAIRGDSPLPPIRVPADGRFHVPYADVPFEYPPPNVPLVLLPRLFAGTFDGYARLFGGLMGAMLVLGAALASRIASDDPAERARRVLAFALLLLAHGAIAIQRLDAVVALLLVVAVWLARRRADRALGFVTGIALATKIVPAFACVAAFVAAGGATDKKRAVRALSGAGVGLALGLGPMVLLSPESLRLVLAYHGARGLHVESSLGVVYGAVKAIFGAPEPGILDFGSFNFHGGVADALAKASTLLTLALVAVVLVVAGRGAANKQDREHDGERGRVERVVLAAFAATVALWLGGKVFSPQYLTWALPLAVAVPVASWRRLALVYGGVLVLSQLYYRGYYDYVYNQRALGVATMVARLVLLGVLFRLLVVGARGTRDTG
jgi:hypothetical protein